MVRKCCAPGCNGNYNDQNKVSVFTFPLKDQERLRFWLKKIPRDIVPTKQTVLCERHFCCDEFIIRYDSVKRPDGSILTMKRDVPKLRNDAYPHIFTNQENTTVTVPSNLSSSIPSNVSKRRCPEERNREMIERDDIRFETARNIDFIQTHDNFFTNYISYVSEDVWTIKKNTDTRLVSFFHLIVEPVPQLSCVIRIDQHLHVEVFKLSVSGQLVKVPEFKVSSFLVSGKLETWTKFQSLLGYFKESELQEYSIKDNVLIAASILETASQAYEDEDSEDNIKGSLSLSFLTEQLRLLVSPIKRYSPDTLLFAFRLYSTSRKALDIARQSLLTLPHSSYLRKVSASFAMSSGLDISALHEEYLKKKIDSMEPAQRDVNLMLDEIHITGQMSYRGGKLEGAAVNKDGSEATTAQV